MEELNVLIREKEQLKELLQTKEKLLQEFSEEIDSKNALIK